MNAPDKAVPTPDPKTRKRLPISYLIEESEVWNRASFRKVIDRTPKAEFQGLIAQRRNILSRLAHRPLHQSYNVTETKLASPEVSAKIISIPTAYGSILWALATKIQANFIVEAGAGFGISSMYLAASISARPQASMLSFEIADYAKQAQESVAMITPRASVAQADFDLFPLHLNGQTEIDLAFIDARHDETSILRSYKTLRGWMSKKSLIIIDDIDYSKSSRAAWRRIVRSRNHPFAALINGRLGVLGT